MKTIFLALAYNSHFSDVLRGKLIRELAKRFRVVVITPAIDDAVAEREHYFKNEHTSYAVLTLAHPTRWAIFSYYLRVPLVRQFDRLVYMQYFYKRKHWWPIKLLIMFRVFLPKFLITTQRLTEWETRFFKPTKEFCELAHRYRPHLLVTATPGLSQFEAQAIIFAKTLGIPTAAVSVNYDNLTSNGKHIRKTDYIAVWNEYMLQEAEKFHSYPKERVVIAGCLRFDHYFTDALEHHLGSREEFLRAKGLDPSKKTVVYAGPTPSNYPPRKEFLTELLRLKEEKQLDGDPNIFIRIHPNDTPELYQEFTNIPGVHFECAGRQVKLNSSWGRKTEMGEEDIINLTQTLRHADVVVQFASTMIIEACIFDKPVINIGFPGWRSIVYEYEYNKGLMETGGVRLANDPGHLAILINRYLANPQLDREERAKLIRYYVPFQDGASYKRVADFLERITK